MGFGGNDVVCTMFSNDMVAGGNCFALMAVVVLVSIDHFPIYIFEGQ
jgi:hypothetical protein